MLLRSAYCVGEFDYVQAQTKNGVLVKVYTPPGKSTSGTFALECATKCLDLYDEFFGCHYPLPKLDMVAIPEFAMGAMENWGLVTYREGKQNTEPCLNCLELLLFHVFYGSVLTHCSSPLFQSRSSH
jgi:aminopeptidase N